MKKFDILADIRVEKLIFGGSGLSTAPDGRRIIIAGGAIPESTIDVRITRVKKNHIEAQIIRTTKHSPYEQDLLPGWQLYGGCKWLPIPYAKQVEIKDTQIHEAFHHMASFTENTVFHPIVPSPEIIGYRNKVEFSWGKYISAKEGIHDDFRFGFHAPAEFDRIINCENCILADEEINAIFRSIDTFSRSTDLLTYDPKTGQGFWRHLVIRKAKKTGEVMILWSLNTDFEEDSSASTTLIRNYSNQLAEEFPHITSVFILHNTGRADIVTGITEHIYGKTYIKEELLGKTFEIQPKSFFQTNSLAAEKLYALVRNFCPDSGSLLVDLYAGTGTIGILLADRFEKVYSVELVEQASQDGAKNALENEVIHIEFVNAKVENFLVEFQSSHKHADVLVIDPPRDGMHPEACEKITEFAANTIIYVSCNPATLVRDLGIILGKGKYALTDIAPVDMFPHTHHIETVVRLRKI